MIKLSKEINYAEIYYTLRCNLKCAYCINAVDGIIRNREEKGYKELAKAINNIDFGNLTLTIGGGEPTLRSYTTGWSEVRIYILRWSALSILEAIDLRNPSQPFRF